MAPPRKQAPQPLPATASTTLGSVGGSPAVDQSPEENGPVVQVNDMTKVGMDMNDVHTLSGPTGNEEPPADIGQYPEVSMQDGSDPSVPVKKCEAWRVVEELSDDEFQVEVANIDSFQMRKCLMRFRIRGELVPPITVLDQVRYQEAIKKFQYR